MAATSDAREIVISPVSGGDDLGTVAALFQRYQAWLAVDLCFQSFEAELAGLPGLYGPPDGTLLLARAGDTPVGCVAIKPLDKALGLAEVKRLYVTDDARGRGLGRRLLHAAIDFATETGYRALYLDTLRQLGAANALYRREGFREIAAYYDNPLINVVYFGLPLGTEGHLPHARDLWFEDFTPGSRFDGHGFSLTTDDIIGFAGRYDPQPFHLDADAAAAGPFGKLAASGFQLIALAFTRFAETGVLYRSGRGGGGLDEVRWLVPVGPDEPVRVSVETLESRPSRSRPDRGVVRLRYTGGHPDGTVLYSFVSTQFVARRPAPG